ncbi:MAG: alkaline phosphatase family protein [Candidatus Bathyarchaeia archaeon]
MHTIDLTDEAIKRIGAAGSNEHGIVKPDYAGLNLSNMKPTILEILGIGSLESKPLHELEPFKGSLGEVFVPKPRRLIILLVDSLNLSLLSSIIASFEKEESQGKVLKGLVTSTFPSVTPTALMTLYTGLPPLAHGVLGFEFYLEEAGRIINPFKLSSERALLRDVFGSSATLFEEAAKHGVDLRAFMPREYAYAPATRRMLGKVKVIGYGSLDDVSSLILGTRNIELYYIYYSRLDEILHEEGPGSHKIEVVIHEVKTLIHALLKEGFGVLLLSDHSFVKVDGRVGIKAGKAKTASNGGRVIYIYDGDSTFEVDGERGFKSFTRDQLIRDGWLGRGEYHERIGETTLVARGGNFLTCEGKDSGDKTTHGGFLAEEMAAPLALFSPF